MARGSMGHSSFPQSEYRKVQGGMATRYIPIGQKYANKAPANAKSVSRQTSGTSFSEMMKAISDAQFNNGINAGNTAAASIAGMGEQQVAGLQDNYAQQMALMAQMGGYEQGRINRDFDNQVNSVGASLAGTGLYNSTVQGNMAQGVERNRQESLGQLNASLLGQQLGATANLGNQVSAAQGQQQGLQNSLAQMLSGLYSQQASTLPTLSSQESNSWNK